MSTRSLLDSIESTSVLRRAGLTSPVLEIIIIVITRIVFLILQCVIKQPLVPTARAFNEEDQAFFARAYEVAAYLDSRNPYTARSETLNLFREFFKRSGHTWQDDFLLLRACFDSDCSTGGLAAPLGPMSNQLLARRNRVSSKPIV